MFMTRLLFALFVSAFSLPAGAVKVTVHNYGHYLVSFEVDGRHSGNFGVGQSRTMDNASGSITLNWLPFGFHWCSSFFIYNGLLKPIPYTVGGSDIDITFSGDAFTQGLSLKGFDVFNDPNLSRPIDFNRTYRMSATDCSVRI